METLPIIKTKIIRHYDITDFEKSIDDFIKDKINYNIQYKPVTNHSGVVVHIALVIYETKPEQYSRIIC